MCSFGQICYHKLSEETFVDVFIEASDVYKTESGAFKMSCCVLILLNPASGICHKYSNTEKKTKLKLNSSNLGLKETWKKGRRQMWHDSWMQTILWYSESQQAVNFNISLKDESFYESLTLFDLEEDVRGLKYSDIYNAYISFTIYCLYTQRQ